MLYALARHPEVQQRLREEVLSVVGPTAVPTSKQLQELHYAKNIIAETLRCVGGGLVCVCVCVCTFVDLLLSKLFYLLCGLSVTFSPS